MDVCLDDGSKDVEKEVHDAVLRFVVAPARGFLGGGSACPETSRRGSCAQTIGSSSGDHDARSGRRSMSTRVASHCGGMLPSASPKSEMLVIVETRAEDGFMKTRSIIRFCGCVVSAGALSLGA